jgi:DNA-binding transcriptional LysR family regulator
MNLVSLETLKIFCDVVRQKSFSRGAAMNHVSQSAASQSILQLEKRMGIKLIDRSKRPVSLTAEGQIYYEECRDLVDRYMALEARVCKKHDSSMGRVNVASIYSVVLYEMDRYVERFLKKCPGGHVRFQYLHPDDVYDSVLTEQADLGLLSFPRAMREIKIVPWRDEPMVLVCPPGHRFLQTGYASLSEIAGEPFVGFESGLAIRRHVDKFLRTQNIEITPTIEFDNIEFIKRGVETGAGVSILPEPTVKTEFEKGTLAKVNVTGLDLTRPLSIIHRRKRMLTPAMAAFIEVLQEDSVKPAGEPPVALVNPPLKPRRLPGIGWR